MVKEAKHNLEINNDTGELLRLIKVSYILEVKVKSEHSKRITKRAKRLAVLMLTLRYEGMGIKRD